MHPLMLVNQVIEINSIVMYTQCGRSWNGSNRLQKRRLVVSYTTTSIHYVSQQLSPSARLHCLYQGLHTSSVILVQSCYVKRPRWPSHRTLQPIPKVLKTLLEKFSYLPTKTWVCAILLQSQLSLMWEHLLTTMTAHLPGNGGSARMSRALQVLTVH